jgi:excinuclease ABC subunit A
VVTDRLTAGSVTPDRLRDSLEIAFAKGTARAACQAGCCCRRCRGKTQAMVGWTAGLGGGLGFSSVRCEACGAITWNPNRGCSTTTVRGAPARSAKGSATSSTSTWTGRADPAKSIRDGAIAPWNTPAYAHELQELLALAGDYGLPVDVPFEQLSESHLRLIRDGVPERNSAVARLLRLAGTPQVQDAPARFLSRWRSYRLPACGGTRLRPRRWRRIGGKNIAEVSRMKIADAREFFADLPLTIGSAPWDARCWNRSSRGCATCATWDSAT